MPGPLPKLHLPFAQWPDADRRFWEQALNDEDPFGNAAGARLAKASRRQYLFAWRRFLGFLAIEEPLALTIAPDERLTLARIRLFVSHLAAANSPRSVAITVDALYKATRIMMPDHDWSWLKAVKARLHLAAPTQGKSGPVITSVPLLDLGQKLMDDAQDALASSPTVAEAVRYRDGLMIALLALIPLRRKNLAAIEIGRHLVHEGEGWFIIISGEEAKAGATIEFAVPKFLGPYLTNYLDSVRPTLIQYSSCNALWISQRGRVLSYSAIGEIIAQHTATHFGFRVTPHDCRDAAVTTWAIAEPGQIGVARDLLAHRQMRTTTKHYNRARGIEASRAYSLLIAGRRRRKATGP